MKVAISLPNPLYDAAEQLASAMQIARSQLYAKALESFVQMNAPLFLTQKLNEVYADQDSSVGKGLMLVQSEVLSREAW